MQFPQFATHCAPGLRCDRAPTGGLLLGGAGVCADDGAAGADRDPAGVGAALLVSPVGDAAEGAPVEGLGSAESLELAARPAAAPRGWSARGVLAVTTVAVALTLFAAVMTYRQSPSFAKHGHFRRASDGGGRQGGEQAQYYLYTPVRGGGDGGEAETPPLGGLALT